MSRERIIDLSPQPELFPFIDPLTPHKETNIPTPRTPTISLYALNTQIKRIAAVEDGKDWLETIKPTEEDVKHAVRAEIGGIMDLAYNSLVHHWFLIKNGMTAKYQLTRACHDLTAHQRKQLEDLAQPVVQTHRRVDLEAIPSMVEDIYNNWKKAVVYGKEKPETLWGPDHVKNRVEQSTEFKNRLRRIYNDRVSSYNEHQTPRNSQHFGEADPAVARNLFANQFIVLPVIFDSGITINYTIPIDYLFSQYVPNSSPQIIVIQRKFQEHFRPYQGTVVTEIQTFLMAAAANLFFDSDRSRYTKKIQPPIRCEDLNPYDVKLYQKIYVTKTAEPDFAYPEVTLPDSRVSQAMNMLHFFAQDWMSHQDAYMNAQHMRRQAFSRPRLPRANAQSNKTRALKLLK